MSHKPQHFQPEIDLNMSSFSMLTLCDCSPTYTHMTSNGGNQILLPSHDYVKWSKVRQMRKSLSRMTALYWLPARVASLTQYISQRQNCSAETKVLVSAIHVTLVSFATLTSSARAISYIAKYNIHTMNNESLTGGEEQIGHCWSNNAGNMVSFATLASSARAIPYNIQYFEVQYTYNE